jgi:hypothetical protein
MIRPVKFLGLVSIPIFLSGYSGVRLSNKILSRAASGSSKLTDSTFSRAKYRSESLGERICPEIVSPVRKLKRRIWLGET